MTHPTRRAVLGGLAGAALAPLLANRAAAATQAVTIQGMAFNPASLAIAAGDTVTFTNADTAPHTATADDGGFDTGRLANGQSASLTFATPGTYPYHCAIHTGMKATITVT